MMSRIPNQTSPLPPSPAEARVLGIRGAMDALAIASAVALAWQAARPQSFDMLGLRIDRVTALFGLLVAGIGAVTLRYSLRALAGDPARERFAVLMAIATGAAWLSATADLMPLLVGAWIVQAIALHGLLTIRHDRPQALLPARTAFAIGRVGDLLLVTAFALAWRDWGSMRVSGFLEAAAGSGDASALAPVAVLLALGAAAKSAQVPMHAWLPETMEAPTPVSALMHAGMVNAGGVLMVRFAPVVAEVPLACLLMVLAGTVTIATGMPSMWAQVKVKRELAWSTIAQMGFMMVQCGLAAFPAAALHVVGHGCYKAWSFLRAGDVPARAPAPAPFARSVAMLSLGTVLAAPAIAGCAGWLGMDLLHAPGECALASVLALSVGQAWAALLGRPADARRTMRAGLAAVAVLVVAAVFGPLAWVGMSAFLAPVIGTPTLAAGALGWTIAAIPVMVMAALAMMHAALPVLDRRPWGFALHVHALNGFYLGTASERLVDAAWPTSLRPARTTTHA